LVFAKRNFSTRGRRRNPQEISNAGSTRHAAWCAKFRKTVLDFYKKHGRHGLPWRSPSLKFRRTKGELNPYRILVSEVMLQQTQVDRVIPYYKKFLKTFPTSQALADASLGDVLRAWQGLGYNRRAKMLHETAKAITMIYHSKFPREYDALVALPGVGEYTAHAVRVFAFNEPEVLIETNIRTVFIHHFFPRSRSVTDKEIVRYIVQTLDRKNPRVWYAALMDYGAHLKKTVPNPSRKSAHHLRQKPFKGSDREIRGALLSAAVTGPMSRRRLDMLPFEKGRIKAQLDALFREKLVIKRNATYHLP